MNILSIHSSPNAETSVSRSLALEVIEALQSAAPGEVTLVARDLYADGIQHWGGAEVNASFTPEANRSEEQRKLLMVSDLLCKELLSCNHLVISTPMWNYSVPSTLKAWVDHVVRPGVTFRYGPNGPEGLVANIQYACIIESAGGIYGGEMSRLNHAGPFLADVLRFIGVREVRVIQAHGTAINRETAMSEARSQFKRSVF